MISGVIMLLHNFIKKTKIKKKINWYKIIAFFVPIFMMLILFYSSGIYPFGDEIFVKSDGFHQYIPFLKEFARRIQNGENLFYTFNLDLGSNFLTLYAYYLASPFNWFCIFVPLKYITEFAGYMMIFKVGVSSLTFYLYLNKRNKPETKWEQIFTLIFCFCYSMSGYWCAYSWNIMWLDCIAFLPLVMLGIYLLIKENKIKLYLFSLTFCILSNYYISIMICIFSVFYFLYEFILNTNKNYGKSFLKKVSLFAFSSIISGGLSACLLVPEIYGLQLSASQNISFPKDINTYFSFLDLIPQHLINIEISMTGLYPNLYSGLIVFLFVPLYFVSNKFSLKEKICNFAFIVIFCVSFYFNFLDFIWHGFHYPNSLPCRQSFIYIALILFISSRGSLNLIKEKGTVIAKIYLVIFIILLYFEKNINEEVFDITNIWVSIIFISIYFILLFIIRKYDYWRPFVSSVLCLFVCLELMINMAETSINIWNRNDYLKNDKTYEELLKLEDNTTFSRTEKRMDAYRTKNDGAWYDYKSVSTFSSSSNKKPSDFYATIGMESSWNASCFRGTTPFMSAFLGVKYELSDSKQNDETVSKLVGTIDDSYLYENLYTFPLGFELDESCFQCNLNKFSNIVENQNKLSKLFSEEPILTLMESFDSEDELIYNPEIKEEGRYFLLLGSRSYIESICYIHNGEKSIFENVDRKYLLDLGYLKKTDSISITEKKMSTPLKCSLYKFEPELLKKIVENLNPFEITSFSETNIKGNITLKEDDLLMFTIPYDEGWSIFVDEEEIKPNSVFNSFLGIPITKGYHDIELKYSPQGFKLGLFITSMSAWILIMSILMRMTIRKIKIQKFLNLMQKMANELKSTD